MDGRDSIVKPGMAFPPYYIQHRGFGSGTPGVATSSAGLEGSHPALRHHTEPGGRQPPDLAIRQHGNLSVRQQADATIRQHGESAIRQHNELAVRHHADQGIYHRSDAVICQHADQSSHHVHGDPGSGIGFHNPSQMGSSSVGFSFQLEASSLAPPRTTNSKASAPYGEEDTVKKKRGRPRKYKQDGAPVLSPSLSTSPQENAIVTVVRSGAGSSKVSGSASRSAPSSEKRGRGRPPGTGKIQQLASIGELVVGSAGTGFTPHVILIQSGEDIASKILSFFQQGTRAVFVISAYGAVSSATLQSSPSGATVTYEGQCEILSLAGSFLMIDDGNSRTQSGGLSICICGSDGRVFGGGVPGTLEASGMVQVIVGSFTYAKPKGKSKVKVEELGNGSEPNDSTLETPTTSAMQDHNPNLSPSPMSGGWNFDMRSSQIDINSSREQPHSLDRDE